MKLVGIEIRNFRSISDDPVKLKPLKKCNIIIGQNNTGKSNVLKAIMKISQRHQNNGESTAFEDLDYHSRNHNNVFAFRLWFETEREKSDDDKTLSDLAQTNSFWFDLLWQGNPLRIVDFSLANLAEFKQANNLLAHLTGHRWNQPVSTQSINAEFMRLSNPIFTRFASSIPQSFVIPEFRQITEGTTYFNNGEGLIKLLSEYQTPPIGKDSDYQKFEKVQNFVRKLLHIPDAILEFTRGEQKVTLVIKNNDLRLPIASFGTGVHELVIMITAVLSKDNALCCIEEPEIHLHPRLQREFVEFLVNETSNQYIITTHSPTLINALATNSNIAVFHLQNQDGATVGWPVLSESESIHAIRDLGLKPSDLMQANCILWIEGLSDRAYIGRWIELLAPDLIEGRDYMFMTYRGLHALSFEADSFLHDLVNVIKLNPNSIVVIDSDKKNDTDQIGGSKQKMKDQCERNGGSSWVTDGKEIENYLSANTIARCCKDIKNVDVTVTLEQFDDFSKILDEVIKNAGAQPLSYDRNKLSLSRKLAEHILLEDIGIPLKNHLERIIAKIREWNK